MFPSPEAEDDDGFRPLLWEELDTGAFDGTSSAHILKDTGHTVLDVDSIVALSEPVYEDKLVRHVGR